MSIQATEMALPKALYPAAAKASDQSPPAPKGVESLSANKTAKAEDGTPLWGEDGFTFNDFLDIVNPLQHIPVVNTLYREFTGDTIDRGARFIGDTVFGGPLGLAVAFADEAIKEETGKTMGEHVVAFFSEDDQPQNGQALPNQVAANDAGTSLQDGTSTAQLAQAATASPQAVESAQSYRANGRGWSSAPPLPQALNPQVTAAQAQGLSGPSMSPTQPQNGPESLFTHQASGAQGSTEVFKPLLNGAALQAAQAAAAAEAAPAKTTTDKAAQAPAQHPLLQQKPNKDENPMEFAADKWFTAMQQYQSQNALVKAQEITGSVKAVPEHTVMDPLSEAMKKAPLSPGTQG